MVTMPYVIDQKDGRGSDLFSRLLQDRIILLTGKLTMTAPLSQLPSCSTWRPRTVRRRFLSTLTVLAAP